MRASKAACRNGMEVNRTSRLQLIYFIYFIYFISQLSGE